MDELTKTDIIKYLKEINDHLIRAGLKGEILICGGASMCLAFDARNSTKDIDALYEPKEIINKIAEKIAKEHNLSFDWINDGAKSFITPTMGTEILYNFENLTIKTVSTDALLAMKLQSARFHSKDKDDAIFLMRKLDIDTPEKAYDILEKYIPNRIIAPKTQYFIGELVQIVSKENATHERKNIKDIIEKAKQTSLKENKTIDKSKSYKHKDQNR